jgi:hypothetical protein
VVETSLVLLAQVILLRLLHRLPRLRRLLRRPCHLRWDIWEVVVVVVGRTVVSLLLQGPGIAIEGCSCLIVRLVDLHGPSLVLGECFWRCLHPRSWRAQ